MKINTTKDALILSKSIESLAEGIQSIKDYNHVYDLKTMLYSFVKNKLNTGNYRGIAYTEIWESERRLERIEIILNSKRVVTQTNNSTFSGYAYKPY